MEYPNGNYDHVLVGPPSVFLLDSKLLHGTSAVGGDSLRSGRVHYSRRWKRHSTGTGAAQSCSSSTLTPSFESCDSGDVGSLNSAR
ncbi:MAG: hypothetical protein H0X39_04575 [Actinobacteria bacterium]|nr:hypothetical protein [Actinomycetota bacterium]